jgi:glycine reductase
MRVVHYLNQFFGGLGGEEEAGAAPQIKDGAVGPGRLLEQVFGEGAQVVRTIICGDSYAAENLDELTELILRETAEADAELFVAGPCFEAGRYGVASGAVCSVVAAELDIPSVTGMALENPGVDLYRQDIFIVDSGQNASAMRDVLEKMAAIALKLDRGEEIGLPAEEGYIARGILRDAFVEQSAAERLVEMLFAKTAGESFESELPAPTFTPTPAPPPVLDMSKAKVAIVTDGGLVPKGNPDNISAYAATNWGSYDISGVSDLKGEDYEISHRGYDTRYVEQDPDRLVPLDVLRELEQDNVVGEIHNQFIATSGLANPLANSRRLGREIAQNLKDQGVDAVILTST